MKIPKKIIWLTMMALLCYAPKTFAIKENVFPESDSVQPIPSSSPNISGNIDWPNGPIDQGTSTNNDPFGDQGTIDNNPGDGNSSTVDNNTNNNNSGVNAGQNNNGAGGNRSSNPASGNQPSSNSNSNGSVNNSASGNSFGGNSAGSNDTSNNGVNNGSTGNQNFISGYNFGNDQTQTQTDTETPGPTDASNTDKIIENIDGQPQAKSPITETTFAWAITFGSGLLLIAAYVLWRLKKNPNDVN